ncbi:hypothetical protein HOY82DRAFT_612511 [Tuber indicum]|nr:hypothetical protein HOY82DRAFT_612511 [Tuber indicum]
MLIVIGSSRQWSSLTIIRSRLCGVPGNITDPDAIQFASRKVVAVSGHVRRVLHICNPGVEIVKCSSNKEVDEHHLHHPRRSVWVSPPHRMADAKLLGKFVGDVLNDEEAIAGMQGVSEEEPGGGRRFGGIEVAVKGLIESGVLGVEKRGGARWRDRFLIGEESKAELRQGQDVGDVIRRRVGEGR